MKKKLRVIDFVNKVFFVIALVIFVFFAVTFIVDDEQIPYYIGSLFSFFTLMIYPFGRDISLLPVKREEAYKKSLKAVKIVLSIFLLVFLIVMLITKLIVKIDTSYFNLIFSVEVIFFMMMFGMYTSHLFRKKLSDNKVISFFIWLIVTIVYLAIFAGFLLLTGACFKNYIKINLLVATLGTICSVLLFIFVDKFRYKVNIKIIKSYDFVAGDAATAIDFAKQHKKLNAKKGE
jgi:hypothetical protein